MSPYAVVFVSSVRRIFASPTFLVMNGVFYLIVVFVYAMLWRAATGGGRDVVAGYSYEAILWYLISAEVVAFAMRSRLVEEIGDDIADGGVVSEMLRPVSIVGLRIAKETGECFAKLLIPLAFGSTLGILLVGLPPNGAHVALGLVSMVLAFACNVTAMHVAGSIAFWIRDAKSAWFVYQKTYFLLGGLLMPLQIFPQWMQQVAFALPFWTMAYAPGRLFSGGGDALLLVGQLAWLSVLLVGAIVAFRAGQRKLQVTGA